MLGNVGTEDRSERSADGDKAVKALTLFHREQIGHERPEDRGVKQIENADPNKEAATNPNLLCFGTTSHCDKKESKDENEKSVSKRNKFSSRHPRHNCGERGVRDQHRNEGRGEHPWQCVHAATRANAVPNRLGDVVTGQDQKMKREPEPQRADFVRLYINDLRKKLSHVRFFHAARTSASRSAVKPARSFDCRSCGKDLNQASVSRAVSA